MKLGINPQLFGGEHKKLSFSIKKPAVLRITRIAMVIALLLAGFFIFLGISEYMSLNNKSATLTSISNYNLQGLKTNPLTKDALQNATDLKDLTAIHQEALSEKDMSVQYFDKLQQPYTYFLQYILFPSMNIWKDRYGDTIDTTIVGQEYLQKNPYVDNNLIAHWTDFFRDIGRNTQYNEINDISIGVLEENENGSFTVPIDVSFSSSNKRSFLMLVDKLSITSNRGNISLINEFMYNLWEQIKTSNGSQLDSASNADQELGKRLYQWLYGITTTGATSPIVTEEIVDRAVLQTVGCTDTNQAFCYFKFREKFRSIPLLAYTLGFPGNNGASQLKSFLQYLPPVINVKQFSFEKKAGTLGTADEYVGKIQIDVFGRAISQVELDEIASVLGKQCFVTTDTPMNPDNALKYLQENTKQFGSIATLSNEKSKDLTDLSLLFANVQKEYTALPRYKKAVKLFELYRMLDDAGLCGVK